MRAVDLHGPAGHPGSSREARVQGGRPSPPGEAPEPQPETGGLCGDKCWRVPRAGRCHLCLPSWSLSKARAGVLSPRNHLWLRAHALTPSCRAAQVAVVVKSPPDNAGDARDAGSIPELGRSPREGKGNPLQGRGTWRASSHGVTKSWTRLSLCARTHRPLCLSLHWAHHREASESQPASRGGAPAWCPVIQPW